MTADLVQSTITLLQDYVRAVDPEQQKQILASVITAEQVMTTRQKHGYIFNMAAKVLGKSAEEIEFDFDLGSHNADELGMILHQTRLAFVKKLQNDATRNMALTALQSLARLNLPGLDTSSLKDQLGTMVLSSTPAPNSRLN